MKSIIGVDPGVNGGMVMMAFNGEVEDVYSFSGQTVDEVVARMGEMSEYIKNQKEIIPRGVKGRVYLEKVTYIKGDGGMGAFTFGKVFGGLLFGFKALGMDVILVPPVLWQSRLECMTGGNKNVTWNKAKEIWPTVFSGQTKGWGLSVADALLIAEYGRQQAVRELNG